MTVRRVSLIGWLGLIVAIGWPPLAAAQPISKEACIDAHSRGQDAKEQGKISAARKLFLTCAQAGCPALVQGDCARFADDLTRQQSSLTFVARDAQGADLVDTAVYVDEILVTSRLDDGRPYDVDPGRHVVRFSCRGKDQVVALVVGTGEQGRAVVATFPAINPPASTAPAAELGARAPGPRTTHPSGSKLLIGAGAVVTAAGLAVGTIGVFGVPSNCSISTNRCTAPPGDPVFEEASSSVQLVNVGIFTSAVGVAALAGGLYWYYSKARTELEPGARAVMPVITGDSATLTWTGSF